MKRASALLGLATLVACPTPDTTDTTDTTDGVVIGDELEVRSATPVEGLPTVIRVEWNQPAAAEAYLEFRTDPSEDWRQSPPTMVERSIASQVILGVPYETEVEYRVVSGNETTPSGSITTADRPDTLPDAQVLVNEPSLWEPSAPYLITSMNRAGDQRFGRWWVMILNRAGQVVWAQETPRAWLSRHVSIAHDEHALLIDRTTFWTDPGTNGVASTIARVTLDGTVEHVYDTPGLHHPFMPLPDGAIAWGAKTDGSRENVDVVDLEGNRTTLWSCADFFNANKFRGECGSNALWWDPSSDHLLFSLWSNDTVVEIDRSTGDTLRWFGNLRGSWTFDPAKSQFWWQHGAIYTPQGTLMVSTKDVEDGAETLVREYELDEKNQVLREVWNFGAGRGVYGEFMGEAHRLPNGNTLHVYGSGGHLAEAMDDGTVAWEVTWKGDVTYIGRTTVWDDLYDLLPQ